MTKSTMYAKALVAAWSEAKVRDHALIVDQFMKQLERERMVALLPEIIKATEQELADRAAREQTVLEVAHDPAKSLLNHFENTLVEERAELVGGFRVRRQNEIIDASVAGALTRIRQSLTQL